MGKSHKLNADQKKNTKKPKTFQRSQNNCNIIPFI